MKTFEPSNDFPTLITTSVYSFEMNNVNSFPAIRISFRLILFPNLLILHKSAFEAILLSNPGKSLLEKETPRIFIAFLPNWPKQEPINPPHWITLDIWALLSFAFIYILLAKSFSNLAVRNVSWDNSSSWKFFLVILVIIPVLFFA